MSGNDKQAQQKRSPGLQEDDLSPHTFEMHEQNLRMAEEDLLAEDEQDDPLAFEPLPRTGSSAIRLQHPTNLGGSRRATHTTTQQAQPIPRASSAMPARRDGPASAPLASATTARSTRNVTTPQSPAQPARRPGNMHWLLYVGVGMVAMLALWVVGSALVAWGSATYTNIAYGNPRTFQTDAVVGHGSDSTQHPSHFIALNLNGQVIIIELRAGNPANSITYTGPHFYESGGNLIAITLTFRDVNHDDRADMLIHFQNNVIVFLNNGTQFVPPK